MRFVTDKSLLSWWICMEMFVVLVMRYELWVALSKIYGDVSTNIDITQVRVLIFLEISMFFSRMHFYPLITSIRLLLVSVSAFLNYLQFFYLTHAALPFVSLLSLILHNMLLFQFLILQFHYLVCPCFYFHRTSLLPWLHNIWYRKQELHRATEHHSGITWHLRLQQSIGVSAVFLKFLKVLTSFKALQKWPLFLMDQHQPNCISPHAPWPLSSLWHYTTFLAMISPENPWVTLSDNRQMSPVSSQY